MNLKRYIHSGMFGVGAQASMLENYAQFEYGDRMTTTNSGASSDSIGEFVQMLQNDVDGMRNASRSMNRDTMLLYERSMCEKFRQLREERGWSQSELADRLAEYGIEMHQTTIAKMEAGKRPLRVAEMFGLAHAFQMPPAAVFHMGTASTDVGMDALNDELARANEQLARYREQAITNFEQYIDVAAEYGVKRDHLVAIMRRGVDSELNEATSDDGT